MLLVDQLFKYKNEKASCYNALMYLLHRIVPWWIFMNIKKVRDRCPGKISVYCLYSYSRLNEYQMWGKNICVLNSYIILVYY